MTVGINDFKAGDGIDMVNKFFWKIKLLSLIPEIFVWKRPPLHKAYLMSLVDKIYILQFGINLMQSSHVFWLVGV